MNNEIELSILALFSDVVRLLEHSCAATELCLRKSIACKKTQFGTWRLLLLQDQD